MKENYLLLAVILSLTIIHLYQEGTGNIKGKKLTKPLIIPLIMFFYLCSVERIEFIIVEALFFSFIGDILLMNKNKFLVAGIAAFALTHILYISVFLQAISLQNLQFGTAVLIIPYVFYAVLVYLKLLRERKSGKLPFILYMLIILVMSYTSFLRNATLNNMNFWLPSIGSLFFISSDSMIAFELLKPSVKNRGVLIMATYVAAQLLIITGFIN